MSALSGFEGALYYDGVQIANVRNWSVTVNRDALDVTSIGDGNRSYVPGLRGTTGTATLLYDTSISGTELNFWNTIFGTINCSNSTPTPTLPPVQFVFDNCSSSKGQIEFDAIITSWTHSISVGEVQSVTVQFQGSGPVSVDYPTPTPAPTPTPTPEPCPTAPSGGGGVIDGCYKFPTDADYDTASGVLQYYIPRITDPNSPNYGWQNANEGGVGGLQDFTTRIISIDTIERATCEEGRCFTPDLRIMRLGREQIFQGIRPNLHTEAEAAEIKWRIKPTRGDCSCEATPTPEPTPCGPNVEDCWELNGAGIIEFYEPPFGDDIPGDWLRFGGAWPQAFQAKKILRVIDRGQIDSANWRLTCIFIAINDGTQEEYESFVDINASQDRYLDYKFRLVPPTPPGGIECVSRCTLR